MQGTEDEDRSERAERVFLDYLAGQLRGEDDGFEALCDAHPELSDELRELRAGHAALNEMRERVHPAGDARVTAFVQELRSKQGFAERFEAGETIGRGGQGEVIDGHERALDRTVAIKRLLASSNTGRSPAKPDPQLARFLAEAQVTAQLDHPGIVSVHELGIDETGRAYFTMTRVRGEDLTKVFEKHARADPQWTLLRCVALLQRVCETMAFAHSRGVVHRDLKPANVMVGSFGEVFVMDWGLARVARDSAPEDERSVRTLRASPTDASLLDTMPSETLGTVFYLAPEVAGGGAFEAGPAVDVYAVGAMLYELAAGHPALLARERRGDVPRRSPARRSNPRHRPHWNVSPRTCPPPWSRSPSARCRAIPSRAIRTWRRSPTIYARSSRTVSSRRMRAARGRSCVCGSEGTASWPPRSPRCSSPCSAASPRSPSSSVAPNTRSTSRPTSTRLPYLEERARSLWPEVPAMIPAMEDWMETASRLASRLPLHRERLAELGNAPLEPARALERETLRDTVRRLEAFAGPRGDMEAIESRMAWARQVRPLTLDKPAAAWDAARAIASETAGPYRGHRLDPQLGLVPLGLDPHSGLLEFALPRSGAVPERGADGALQPTAETSLVFVWIPRGTFAMGAQAQQSDRPGFDPAAMANESPVHTIQLASFFLSKYEMTFGQWLRLTGETPGTSGDSEEPDLAAPVTAVSWARCMATLPRYQLSLPSEAQWEYAARAGSVHPFFESEDPQSLIGRVNLADSTVLAAGLGWPQARGMQWLDDGFVQSAPVGSFAANAFGLHDTLGNVWEWAADRPGSYALDVEPDTGLRKSPATPDRVARGGGYVNNAAFARITIRDSGRSANFDSGYHGLRPIFSPAQTPK